MKRHLSYIFSITIFLCLIFARNTFAAENCTTDEECQNNPTGLYGCAYVVEGLSTSWLCQAQHPDLNFCSSDDQCNPGSSNYQKGVYGCQNTMSHWTCRTIRTPGEGTSNDTKFCDANKKNFNTALGCIPTDPEEMANSIISLGVSLGGGVALALILYGVFILTTSSGIPDKINAGKDVIFSAVSGLIMISLSIVIFRLIGIDILGLPGLQ